MSGPFYNKGSTNSPGKKQHFFLDRGLKIWHEYAFKIYPRPVPFVDGHSLLRSLTWTLKMILWGGNAVPSLLCFPAGCIARTVSSPNQHLLRTDDVISCCLDLSAPSISFRINGQPVQGMFENFNIDGLFFPVVSFSAGIKWVSLCFLVCLPSHIS